MRRILASASVLKMLALALPVLVFLLVLFYVPAVNLLRMSFFENGTGGTVAGPIGFAQYARLFSDPLYLNVLMTTLRVSLVTAVLAAVIAVPVAMVMTRAHPTVAHLINLIVLAPLLISVVVRAYGWQLILANGPNGVLNWLLLQLGLIQEPLKLMYTETAVVIGSLHVLFPMMLLPLTASMSKIDPALEDAARLLGASSFRVVTRIIVPLSLPGLLLGFALVFALTAGSYVIPAILGGARTMMIGNLIEQQIFVVYDRPFGAALAILLVGVVFAVTGLAGRLAARRARINEATP